MFLLFRASEHGYRSSSFHKHCDGKGPTITLVKADNGRIAAFYSGVAWPKVVRGSTIFPLNPRGFIASIKDVKGKYTFKKYSATSAAYVVSFFDQGPCFGRALWLNDQCQLNEDSRSYLFSEYWYDLKGVDGSLILFGAKKIKVLEYEVYQVEQEGRWNYI